MNVLLHEPNSASVFIWGIIRAAQLTGIIMETRSCWDFAMLFSARASSRTIKHPAADPCLEVVDRQRMLLMAHHSVQIKASNPMPCDTGEGTVKVCNFSRAAAAARAEGLPDKPS